MMDTNDLLTCILISNYTQMKDKRQRWSCEEQILGHTLRKSLTLDHDCKVLLSGC